MKTVLAIGDTHSGSVTGLTPPEFELGRKSKDVLRKYRIQVFDWMMETIPKKIDVCIITGDLIDGEGYADTSFLLYPNVNDQIEMSKTIISHINAKDNIFVRGTPFHAGKNVDYENHIASAFGGDIKTTQRITVNGIKYKCYHTISKTSTPVGGDISHRKGLIWDKINNKEHADFLLYGHTHEYREVGSYRVKSINIPSMQIASKDHNRYARRMGGGYYDIGFVVFNIPDKCNDIYDVSYRPHLLRVSVDGGYREIN